jgi:hypothetical protein
MPSTGRLRTGGEKSTLAGRLSSGQCLALAKWGEMY